MRGSRSSAPGAHVGPIKPLAKSGARSGGKGMAPHQPSGPPPRHVMGGGHHQRGRQQASWEQVYQQPMGPQRPSFMGAASRKRVMELMGLLTPGAAGNGHRGGAGADVWGAGAGQSKSAKKRKKAADEDGDAPAAAEPAADGEEASLPQDVPIWITLPDDEPRPDLLEATSSVEALVISWGGTKRKGLYNQAEGAIKMLLGTEVTTGEDESEVQYHDDANWEHFPQIGKSLTRIAKKEECMSVAVCNSRDLWAVGIGMKGKSRYGAGKAALAVTIALQTIELEGALSEDFNEQFPIIAEFAEEAKTAKEGGAQKDSWL